jgi:hypothetical protein
MQKKKKKKKKIGYCKVFCFSHHHSSVPGGLLIRTCSHSSSVCACKRYINVILVQKVYRKYQNNLQSIPLEDLIYVYFYPFPRLLLYQAKIIVTLNLCKHYLVHG